MRSARLLLCLLLVSAVHADEQAAAKVYDDLRAANGLEAFLRAFPKGGDLHNHLGGAISPETWIQIAIKHNFCVNEQLLILVQDCPAGMSPASTLQQNRELYQRLLDAMSMRGNRGGPEKAHDHFFQAFRTRAPVPGPILIDELEDAIVRANGQNLTYLELMIYPFAFADSDKVTALLSEGGSFSSWLETLENAKPFRDLVASGKETVERAERELQERRPAEAAAIRRRYLIGLSRTRSPQNTFSQLVAVAELARVEPTVVGVNLAGAEDNAVSIRDFHLHMRMIDFLLSKKPWLRVTLHAGELQPWMFAAKDSVPEPLTFHIAESVWNGHAERIGHGTDLLYEKDHAELLRTMRERGVLAEICLTSEEVIQNLKPQEIPFAAYRQTGVPVSLNTDDEGILGSDLSHEFLNAAGAYQVSYRDLKELARNSIEYSFLPGHSLFRARDFRERVPACSTAASADCRAYLENNPKAEAQMRLEQQFEQFESNAGLRRFERKGTK